MPIMNITMKDHGTIRITLWPEIAPAAVHSVMNLIKKGKYNNRPIERLEPDFVIQPLFQDGEDEEIDALLEPEFQTILENAAVRFRRGIVAMAGIPDFASAAQYFITLKEKDRLNGSFTVIGEVLDGWDEIERLEKVAVDAFTDPESGAVYHVPRVPQIVETVTLTDLKSERKDCK